MFPVDVKTRRRVSRKQLSGFIAPSARQRKIRLRSTITPYTAAAYPPWWEETWMTVLLQNRRDGAKYYHVSIAREIRFLYPISNTRYLVNFAKLSLCGKLEDVGYRERDTLSSVTRRPIKRIGKIIPDRYFFRQTFITARPRVPSAHNLCSFTRSLTYAN